MGVMKQEKDERTTDLLLEGPKKMMVQRLGQIGIKLQQLTPERMLLLINHLKIVLDHCLGVLRMILLQQDHELAIQFSPVEFLYEHNNIPGKTVQIRFASNESRMIGLICPNEASLEYQSRSLKSRQLSSKSQQLLTEVRRATLVDARQAKLDAYITNWEEHKLELGPLGFSGDISEFSRGGKVRQRIELLGKSEQEKQDTRDQLELEQQQTLERARQDRLQALRTIYFNEKVLKRLFEELSAWFELEVLTMLKNTFKSQFNLGNEHRRVIQKLNELNETLENDARMPQDMQQILNAVKHKIVQHCKTILPELESLDTIWQRIIEMTLTELS